MTPMALQNKITAVSLSRPGPMRRRRRQRAGEPTPTHPHPPTHQMSEASFTGVCSMISGATNSGEPYLLYCGSPGVIFWAKPKSQILMSSRAGCTIRMLGGCQAESGVAEHTLRKEPPWLPGLGRTLRGL